MMMSKELQRRVDECLRCYEMCFGMAMTHCLEQGGEHVKPSHFRAMIVCADMCREAAQMMLAKAPRAAPTSAAFARMSARTARANATRFPI
jgi:hypothetical protein